MNFKIKSFSFRFCCELSKSNVTFHDKNNKTHIILLYTHIAVLCTFIKKFHISIISKNLETSDYHWPECNPSVIAVTSIRDKRIRLLLLLYASCNYIAYNFNIEMHKN